MKIMSIWQNRAINQNTKVHLIETLVFSVFLYECETWTLKGKDKQRTNSFEMWCLRRMLQILLIVKKINVSVVEELNISK